MKKTYITPRTISFSVASEGLISTSSVGLENGNDLGNQLPDGNTDENFFTNSQGYWDSEW